MAFGWTAAELDFREQLRGFIADTVPPEWATLIPGEHVATDFTRGFSRALADRGLFASQPSSMRRPTRRVPVMGADGRSSCAEALVARKPPARDA